MGCNCGKRRMNQVTSTQLQAAEAEHARVAAEAERIVAAGAQVTAERSAEPAGARR